MEVRFWAATDSGRKRSHNEDNFLVDRDLRLFLVCDGMGGHAAGEVASAAAIQTVREEIRERVSEAVDVSGLDQTPSEEAEVCEMLGQAVRKASERVWSMAQQDETREGMGTTCSLLMCIGGKGYVAHVGDSRIYRIGRNGASQVTDDHSLRNHMIREGRLGENERLDRHNAVTRAVGVVEAIEVDTFTIDLEPEDRFVLCSDGLSDYLDEASRLAELAAAEDLEEATWDCIDFANRSGGKDNVTVVLVEVDEGEGVWDARRSTPRGRALRALPHFEHLGADEFQRVSEVVELETLEEGQALGGGGQKVGALVLVIDGELELVEDGDVADLIGPGDFVGERALLGAGGRHWSLRALEATEIAYLDRDAFEEILGMDESLAMKIQWNFLRRWAGKFQHYSESAFRNPELVLPPDGQTQEYSGRSVADALEVPTGDAEDSTPSSRPEEGEADATSGEFRERSEQKTVNLNLDDDATNFE